MVSKKRGILNEDGDSGDGNNQIFSGDSNSLPEDFAVGSSPAKITLDWSAGLEIISEW
jgi:hypothetical protein